MISEEKNKGNGYCLNKEIGIVFESPDDGYSYFFGYYDKSPFNEEGNRLLAHRVSFDCREVEDGDVAEVGYFCFPDQKFYKIGETLAWNWQQGSQLQWLPLQNESKVIYNDVRSGKYVSIVYDIDAEKESVIPFPIYAVNPMGKFALGVNYERLAFCRPGYNYRNILEKKWDKPVHPEDGIFKIDLNTGQFQTIIKTEKIVEMLSDPRVKESPNWLEHMMWNPDGSRFAFLHRWESTDGEHHSRLITADSDGKSLCFFPDVRFYSHMGWKNNKEFTIWSIVPTKTSRCVSSIAKNKSLFKLLKFGYKPIKNILGKKKSDSYFKPDAFITYKDCTELYSVLNRELLPKNGHNSWSSSERWMLTDTYQDTENFRHLLLYDNVLDEIYEVGKFYSRHNNCGYRADLHPRYDRSEKLVAIDSTHRGNNRCMVVLCLEGLLDSVS